MFTATLPHPGNYTVVNANTQSRGEIVVTAPQVDRESYCPPEPVTVECTDNALNPASVKIMAMQGLIYHFRVPLRIRIEPTTTTYRMAAQPSPVAH